MKIGIQTWGSNGDIRPMIALANGLQTAGHHVTLNISSIDNRNYSQECKEFNLSSHHIPETISFDLEAFARQTFRTNTAQWLIALLESAFFPYEDIIYQAATQLVTDNDLVIGHHFLYPLKIAAQLQKKPFISVTFCHGIIPAYSHPPFRFPNLSALINPIQWRLMDFLFDLILKKRLSRLWNREGLPNFKHVITQLLSSDILNLVAVDPAFCPTSNEWPQQHHVCGFLNFPKAHTNWRINSQLKHFLDSGPRPVYMTFGSLQQAIPEWSMSLFIEASQIAGCRAIIQTSSANYPEDSQLNDIFFIGRHPHQNLFPQCAAIVHHGGAGTTHSASLCGRPSIIIPFMDEQLFWGRTLQKLGLACKPLQAKNATAKQLASRITTLLLNESYAVNALKISTKIRTQHGVKNAVAMIEKTYQQQHLHNNEQ